MTTSELLESMGVDPARLQGGSLAVQSPIDGAVVARLREHTADETAQAIGRAQAAFLAWRNVSAPRRGELIRLLGDELRANKQALGRVVSIGSEEQTSELQALMRISYAVFCLKQKKTP